ncbi:MAG: CBS domain-containing protein [Candidatus Binatia bacterium]|jgi:CBS domain-containing protein/anti-sigma regulatory factor (Ser/Thr protein kinase)
MDRDIGEPSATPRLQELAYELRVAHAMNSQVLTVSPETTFDDLRILLRTWNISGAPVVEGHRMVGIISIEDLIVSLSRGQTRRCIGDVMTREVVSLYTDQLLVHAIQGFKDHPFGRFPVLERDTGRLAGILTKGDIIRCMLQKLEGSFYEEENRRYRASHIFTDLTADAIRVTFQYKVKGGDFSRAGECSGRLKANLRRLGIRRAVVRPIAIATYEAEMNLVVFTPGGEITAEVSPERISVTVVDTGPGIADIEKAMQAGYSTAPDWVRELGFGAGMGLPNIKRNSDTMSIESQPGKGTKLEFTTGLDKPGLNTSASEGSEENEG